MARFRGRGESTGESTFLLGILSLLMWMGIPMTSSSSSSNILETCGSLGDSSGEESDDLLYLEASNLLFLGASTLLFLGWSGLLFFGGSGLLFLETLNRKFLGCT